MLRAVPALLIAVLTAGAAFAGPVAEQGQKAEAMMASDPVAALDALDAAIEEVWTASPLLFRKVLFVDSASGFGIYSERSGAVFKPGEPIIIYGEPVGFAYGKNGLGGLEINLAVDLVLVGADGAELIAKEDFAAFVLPVRYHNREFQITLTANLTGLPNGKYVGRFTIRDKHSEKSGRFELPFEIAG